MRDPSHSGDKSTKSELEGPSVPLSSESRPLLAVEDLRTHFFTRAGVLRAVDGASFSVDRGQIVGLVGESGSGKSVTAFSIMGVVDYPGRIVGGSILFDGNELVNMEEEQFRTLRGRRIAMIFQDPMMTLNPVLRIDRQIIESIRAHDDIDWLTARAQRTRGIGPGRDLGTGRTSPLLPASAFRRDAPARGHSNRASSPAGSHHR